MPRTLYAALNLLDRQLVDVDGALAGRVDDLELDASGDALLVTAALSGPGTLWRRLGSHRLADWLDAAHRRDHGRAARIPLAMIEEIGPTVRLRARHDDLASFDTEQWIRDHVTRHIPGSAHAPE